MTNGELIRFLMGQDAEGFPKVDGKGVFPCPECGKLATEPAPYELGDMAQRGWYCSVACKVAYIGTEPEPDMNNPMTFITLKAVRP